MQLIDAVKTIRKELLIKDEPLKAYNLLKELNLPELKPELDRTYGLVAHLFDEKLYQKMYGMGYEDKVLDCEMIEPRSLIKEAGKKYPRYQWIIEEARVNKPKTYCDLACYVGSLVTTLQSMGIESTGVDMTAAVIDVARDRAKFADLDAKFYCADITKWTGGPFDMLSAFEVIEHVKDPEAFVKHLTDICDGWVYITTPNGPFGNGEGNEGHWDWDGVDIHVRGHVRVFTKESMKEMLEDYEVGFLDTMKDGLVWAKFRRKK